MDLIYKHLGEKPFHLQRGLNAAAFDAVAATFAGNLTNIPTNIKNRFTKLKSSQAFQDGITSATTDNETVVSRLRTAKAILIG